MLISVGSLIVSAPHKLECPAGEEEAHDTPAPKEGDVRVRVLAAGVSLPDIMAREGVHPETPPLPFTPGWDLVGVVDRQRWCA